jgi:hypothetical protein
VTWDQVSLANASQLGDYKVVIPKASDHISQITNKYVEGDVIITTPYAYTSLDACFLYKYL